MVDDMEQKVLGHYELHWYLNGTGGNTYEGKMVFRDKDRRIRYMPSQCVKTNHFYLKKIKNDFNSKGKKEGSYKNIAWIKFSELNWFERRKRQNWFKVQFLSDGLDSSKTQWYTVHDLSDIEERKCFVEETLQYTMKELSERMPAEDFIEYVKDRGITITR